MNNIIKLVSVISIISLVSACSVTPSHHMDIAARKHIETTDSYLTVSQNEIYAEIVRSNTTAASGGGLLFALIDSAVDNSRAKSAETLIQPIRNSLIDFDFAEILHKDIEEKLMTIDWMNLQSVVLQRSSEDQNYLKNFKKSEASAVLFMTADYKLTSDFDGIITSVSLIMFPNIKSLVDFKEKIDKNANPVDQSDNIYRNTIVKKIQLGITGNKEENAKTVAKENAIKVREALEKSANAIAQQIFDDIHLEDKK